MVENSAVGGERFVLLEDTSELRCEAPNHVSLHTSENVTLGASRPTDMTGKQARQP